MTSPLIAFVKRLGTPASVALTVGLSVAAVVGIAGIVDLPTLRDGLGTGLRNPLGLTLAVAAFGLAFGLRAVAWSMLQPGLSLGQSLAAIHVSLAGNHVLPLRLGEPLRVLSAVRRARVDPLQATASTVSLRAADLLSLLMLGLLAGPVVVLELLGTRGLVLIGLLVLAAGGGILLLRHRRPAGIRGLLGSRLHPGRLGVAILGLTTVAWLLEAVLVWQVARWFDLPLPFLAAVVVLAATVASQLLALTPGGVGTYEAVAAAALVSTGASPRAALATAVTMHLVKTIYSLVAGAVGVLLPTPGLLGNLRLSRRRPARPGARAAGGPVMLFTPAYNEGPRVADVVGRAPTHVAGHPVDVVVIDDGSTDDTAARARQAGARVISHAGNRGLGAAVRTGLAAAVESDCIAVAFCDADGEYDPAELTRLVTPILEGDADYVVGSRFAGTIRHMRPHRRLGNLALTTWVRWTVRAPVTDGQSGYRAFSPAAAASAVIPHDYNYAQVLTIDLLQSGFAYHEVPIDYHFRRSGASFIRLGSYLRRVVPTVWRQLQPAPTPDPSRLSA